MPTATLRPVLAGSVRFNSTQQSSESPSDAARRKKALQEKDRLQKDWDAKVISYEDVLPKIQNPTPVCHQLVAS